MFFSYNAHHSFQLAVFPGAEGIEVWQLQKDQKFIPILRLNFIEISMCGEDYPRSDI